MKIINRLSSGLVRPKNVLSFSEDKPIITIIFIFILVVIMSIPGIIQAVLANPIDYATKTDIRESFNKEVVPYEIKDGKLVCLASGQEPEWSYVNGYYFSFLFTKSKDINKIIYYNSLYQKNYEIIVFGETSVYISLYTIVFKLCDYSDISDFEGLNFTKSDPNNYDLWDPLFNGLSKIYSSYKPYVIAINTIINLVSNAISFMLMALIITFVSRFGKVGLIPFSKSLKISIYFMVPYALGDFLGSISGLRLLSYIGLGFTLINVFRINFIVGGSRDE